MHKIKAETIWSQFFAKIFAKTTEFSGNLSRISKSTLAGANRERDCRIYADYAQALIKQALPLCKVDNKLCKEI